VRQSLAGVLCDRAWCVHWGMTEMLVLSLSWQCMQRVLAGGRLCVQCSTVNFCDFGVFG